jgi:hypothetical protein
MHLIAVTWDFAYLMPHVRFPEPIENNYLALVPPDDERLIAIARRCPAVRRLTNRFADQFRRPIEPSALLVRSDAPASVDFHAVASFRNLIAVCSVIDGWCFQLKGGSAAYPLWADYFDFYPFTSTKDGGRLTARSVASIEIDGPQKFSGQRAAHLPSADRLSFGTDALLLAPCLKQWERRFVKRANGWGMKVLFRSLQIACQAARMPAVGTGSPTIHDAGVGIALWVSAMEIVSHPRNANASLNTVVNLLGGADWIDSRLRAKRYKLRYRDATTSVNYSQRLYAELYRARNDFLHGNPVTAGSLFPAKDRDQPLLLHCAPLLYRAALGSFLSIRQPQIRGGRNLQGTFEAKLNYRTQQRTFEAALRRCQTKSHSRPVT